MEETATPVAVATEQVGAVQAWLLTTGMDIGMNIVAFLITLIIASFVIKIVCGIAGKALNKSKRVSDMLEQFTQSVLRKVLWLVAFMVALPCLGIDVGPMIAGLGVGGFIIGFAFQESLGNLAAGLMLLLNEPFKVGHLIQAGGHLGKINELNMMATTMTTGDNKLIVIPNSGVWGSAIVNYSALDTRRVDMTVGISYAADISEARATIQAVVDANELVLKDPGTQIELVEMADSSLNLVVRPWCKNADYWGVFFSVNQQMKEALDAKGIEIPFPQMDLHLPDGAPSAA
ncbi:MAG: small conductance mechanosensitive channel [Rhodothermales bacterium]|jgi:small conductance mechanosensitive channel